MEKALKTAIASALYVWTFCLSACSTGDMEQVYLKNVVVQSKVICLDNEAKDQDDMCIWVHPADPDKTTIIASDKKAERIFVYDLWGKTIQALSAPKPGNIDVRYNFPLGGNDTDIVAFNQREAGYKIVVCRVDPQTGKLERIDNNNITTGKNYGGSLYHSKRTGKFYFIATSHTGRIEQYELTDDAKGKIAGNKVREWLIGSCEGIVADDESGRLYIAEEKRGVWEVGAEPGDQAPGDIVIKAGENGLEPDVEGMAIYFIPEGEGYLIVSSQGSSAFKIYERKGKHKFIGTFSVQKARETDGIDVTNANLGPHFPEGLFACHSNDEKKCPVLLTPWGSIAKALGSEIKIDTLWNPRR
jgi:3-phytase